MFSLNSFHHDSTGYSPAELFLYRKLQGPGEWVEESQILDNSESMFENARKNMKNMISKNKKAYDQKRSVVSIKIGDNVLLKSHPLSNLKKNFSAKLAPKWRGPYKVLSQLSPVNFAIQCGGDTRVAHSVQLKVVS